MADEGEMDIATVRLHVHGPGEEGRSRPADPVRELHDAAMGGDCRRVEEVLSGTEAPTVDAMGNLRYTWDKEKCDWERCGTKAESWNRSRLTALALACGQGHTAVVRYLVDEKGVNIHAWGEQALGNACFGGHFDIVRYLVDEKGADIHANRERALGNACGGGHLDIVRYLVEEKRVDVHADRERTLHSACSGGYLDIVRYLVEEKEADVHADRELALASACRAGHLDIVRYLVEEKEADVHADRELALASACGGGHFGIVRYLVEEKGVDVHAWNERALGSACREGHLDIVRYLVEEKGVDVHAGSGRDLASACSGGHFGIVRYLVEEKGVDVHAWNEQALRNACEGGHFRIVRYLVEDKRANIHAYSESALGSACERGHFGIVRHLVEEYGASPRTLNGGRSALTRSAQYNRIDIVLYLIQRDPVLLAISDAKGKFPLDEASDECKDEVEQILPRKVLKGCRSTTPPPSTELHLVGFGGVGKTRLKSALTGHPYQEAPEDSPVHPQTGRKLAECTVGATVDDLHITSTSWSNWLKGDLRRVKVFDYGGQAEFRSNIATILPRATTSVIIVAVSLASPDAGRCRAALTYFLKLVASCQGLMSAESACSLAVVATHADLYGGDVASLERRLHTLTSTLRGWSRKHPHVSLLGDGGDGARGQVFCVNAQDADDEQLVELRATLNRRLRALYEDDSRRMPRYCSKMLEAIQALRKPGQKNGNSPGRIAPCLPKDEAIHQILRSEALNDDEMPVEMAPVFLDYLERCGEVMTLRAPATSTDGDWLVLDTHALMHRVVGRLQASSTILSATRRIEDVRAQEALRDRLRQRQARNQLTVSPEEMAQLTGCDEIFPSGSATQRAQLMLHILEQTSLCVSLDASQSRSQPQLQTDTEVGPEAKQPEGTAAPLTAPGRLFFPAFAQELLGEAGASAASTLALDPAMTRVGRRFVPAKVEMSSHQDTTPTDATRTDGEEGKGASAPGPSTVAPTFTTDHIFPPGCLGHIQAAMVRRLRDRWAGSGEVRVNMYRDSLIVAHRESDGDRCKVVLRAHTLDTMGAADETSSGEPTPSLGEILDVHVACVEKECAAYDLLQDIRDHAIFPHVPWMAGRLRDDDMLDDDIEEVILAEDVGKSPEEVRTSVARPPNAIDNFGACFDDTRQLIAAVADTVTALAQLEARRAATRARSAMA